MVLRLHLKKKRLLLEAILSNFQQNQYYYSINKTIIVGLIYQKLFLSGITSGPWPLSSICSLYLCVFMNTGSPSSLSPVFVADNFTYRFLLPVTEACDSFCQVSSVEIEKVCNAADESILETAAVGVPPPGGGPDKLVIAVVFKDSKGSKDNMNSLKVSINSALQKKLNPLFKVIQLW